MITRPTELPSAAESGVAKPIAPWYAGVTSYQWLVLAIASAGWIFDVYQGQIFNITRNQLLADILKERATDAAIKNYGDVFLAIFLAGGAVGGILFGSLADRWGRRRGGGASGQFQRKAGERWRQLFPI